MHVSISKILFSALAGSLLISTSRGDLLLYEGFNYELSETLSDNVLQGKSPEGYTVAWHKSGAPTPAAGADPATDLHRVVAGSLSYPGLPASVGGRMPIPQAQNGNTTKIAVPGGPYNPSNANSIYFSFVLKLTSWVPIDDGLESGQAGHTAHQAGFFIAGFTATGAVGGGMSGANVFAGQLRLRREVDELGVQSGKYQFGFHKNNLSGGVATWDTTQSFGLDESVLVVGEYQFNADGGENTVFDDAVRLWLNPVPGQSAPETPNVFSSDIYDVSTAGGVAQSNIAAFWFQSRTTNILPGDLEFDELRIGKTFESVTPAAAAGMAGDFNGDNVVDGADFLAWQRGESPSSLSSGDLETWKSQFGVSGAGASVAAIPEPTSAALIAVASLGLCRFRRRR
jgi:hypothetical protein